jgi:lipoic acid synthetase
METINRNDKRIHNNTLRRPEWLKVRLGVDNNYNDVRRLIADKQLHTVCESARCPNIGECWSRKTATFMILGDICTRNCKFCNISAAKPTEYDEQEPQRVAEAVEELNLRHAVITSVTRDDLDDGGASIFAETIHQIRKRKPSTTIEVLIPDFKGNISNLNTVLDAGPDVLNHNIEVVKRLQKEIRVQASYERSLLVLKHASQRGFIAKSGLMVGFGEEKEEILQAFKDLRENGCTILTIGQYLPPTKAHYPLFRFYHPDEFEELKTIALQYGFTHVESGPKVRSSYHADQQF